MTARLARIVLNVTDPARTAAFFRDALGFVIRAEDCCVLGYGDQLVTLRVPAQPGAPYPDGIAANDLAFQHIALVVTDMQAAYARLMRFAPALISRGAPISLPATSGGVTALKFRDPEGHPLELLSGLPGPARIDHSAISVADADRSIAFYAATLGLTLGARGHNTGPEQDHLDGLDGVSVDVVPLLPTPATPQCRAARVSDAAWTRHNRGPGRHSPRPRLVFAVAGRTATALTCDPDGHRLELIPAP